MSPKKKGKKKVEDDIVEKEIVLPPSSDSEEEPKPAPKKKSGFAAVAANWDDSDNEDESPKSPEPEKSPDPEPADFGKKSKKDKKGKSSEPPVEEMKELKVKDEFDPPTREDGKKDKKKGKEKEPEPKPAPKPAAKEDKKKGKKEKPAGPALVVAEVLKKSAIPKKDKLSKLNVDDGVNKRDLVTSAPNLNEGDLIVFAPVGSRLPSGGPPLTESKIGGVMSFGMVCGPNELLFEDESWERTHALVLPKSFKKGDPVPEEEAFLEALKAAEAEPAAPMDSFDSILAEFAGESQRDTGKKKKEKVKKEEDGKPKKTLADWKKENEAANAEYDAQCSAMVAELTQKDDGEEEPEVEEKALTKGQLKKLKEKKKAEAAKKAQEEAAGAQPEAAAAEPAPDEAGDEDEEDLSKIDRSKLSKGQLKKLKEKEKAAAAKAAGVEVDKKKKEEPKKKETAAVRLARERMEAQRIAEEQRLKEEEEERLRIEEEERIAKEDAEKAEALRAERLRKKKEKQDRLRAEGLLLTKKQKEERARAEAMRKQFEEMHGITKDDGAPKKKPIYSNKKKKPKKQDEEEEAAALPEEEAPEEEEKESEGGLDDWEDAADDDWEMVKKDADEDEDEEDESDEESSDEDSDEERFRSPIICIMGHVDTGKTKLLDKIRHTNVQEGEAGGITQQIGATYFPVHALQKQCRRVVKDYEVETPGMLIIDTPGHESFNNLRDRGSSLCDLAILVIDIMHGLEQTTLEALEMLRKRKCPFVIALNKIDRLYDWKENTWAATQETLASQKDYVIDEFDMRWSKTQAAMRAKGLNTELYYKNPDLKSFISVIPTSAMTGEGVPDLLYMLLKLTTTVMSQRITYRPELQCTVLEVKAIEGFGTTIDVLLVNGELREGDTIVVCGMNGAIVTTIRALLTPQPMKEMRVKGSYQHHKKMQGSMGIKIAAPNLDQAVAGGPLLVATDEDDLEDLEDEVQEDFEDLVNFEKEPEGVFVMASTLGSLEALLKFLQDENIPVFGVNIGVVNAKDVKRASIMNERKKPEYAVILAFDVKVTPEAKREAESLKVRLMTADIIYHLFDQFTAYNNERKEAEKAEKMKGAVFPVMMKIIPQYIFNKKDPIVLGVNVQEGQLRLNTPLCALDPKKTPVSKGGAEPVPIGYVAGIEINKKAVEKATKGQDVCVKIAPRNDQTHIMFGRHFDASNPISSVISRDSIDCLKEVFKDEMSKDDWKTVIKMKTYFDIE